MVVEDEVRTRNSIIKLIGKINPGYQVVGEAADGAAGLAVIAQTVPDLVITDIKMPRVDGLEMIKRLKTAHPELVSKFIILSGYAEFAYAQQAMRLGLAEYLLKPITVKELVACLQTMERALAREKAAASLPALQPETPERLLERAISDPANAPAYLEQLERQLGDGAPPRSALALLRLEPDFQATERADFRAIVAAAAATAAPEIQSVLAELASGNEWVLFFRQSAAGAGAALLERIRATNADRWTENVVAGYVEFDGLAALGPAYLEISAALKWHLVAEAIVYPERLAGLTPVRLVYPKEIEGRIVNRIAAGDFEPLGADLGDFFAALRAGAFHPDDVREAVARLAGALLYAIRNEEAGRDAEIKSTQIIGRLEQSLWLSRQRQVLERLIRRAAERRRADPHYSLLVRKALTIIHEEYQNDLSLDYVAHRLAITPEYLSALFARETGRNFVTYLTEWRINKSKELLLSRQFKIYEIARMVGYADVKYYCKVFKKVTGYATGDYLKIKG